jgi:hypothetical protein
VLWAVASLVSLSHQYVIEWEDFSDQQSANQSINDDFLQIYGRLFRIQAQQENNTIF